MSSIVPPTYTSKRIFASGLATACVFFVLVVLKLYYHELWQDEWQAWLIARDSTSISDLFKNMRYEGHPALWHLLLHVTNRVVDDPAAMQALHALIATAVVLCVVWYAPWHMPEKVLFSIGYFPFFEYANISRNYALGLLCAVLFCALFRQRDVSWKWMCALLLLIPQTNMYAAIVAVALGASVMVEALLTARRDTAITPWRLRPHVYAILCLAAGLIAAAIQMMPPPDGGIAIGWKTDLSIPRLTREIATAWRGYVPIPRQGMHFWGTNFLDAAPSWQAGSALCAIAVFALALLRRPAALGVFLVGTFGLLTFISIKYHGAVRHHGHFFVVLISAWWIGQSATEVNVRPIFLNNWSALLWNWRRAALIPLLTVHAIAGIYASTADLLWPFSASEQVVESIRRRGLADMFIVGDADDAASSVAGLLRRPVYYPASHGTGTFVIWNRKRNEWRSSEILDEIEGLLATRKHDILLILNYPLPHLPPNIAAVEKFERSIVGDERYYLYLVSTRDAGGRRSSAAE